MRRRQLLAAVGAGVAGGTAGCSGVTDVFPEADPVADRRQVPGGSIDGRVLDTDGAGVSGVTVTAVGADRTTTTDDRGAFSFAVSRPSWLRVTADGYTERVVAGSPRRSQTVVVAEGAVSLSFGGDVMFGRRFYRPSTDRLAPRAHIRPERRRADHDRLLAPVAPLLRAADLTSVNVESPLTTSGLRHPEKQFTFTSHPVAAAALGDAGVDYAALGNNHAFDALAPGLQETTESLDDAGVAHSGASVETAADAWAPAVVERRGLQIGLVSCSDVLGTSYDLHWSADRTDDRPQAVTQGGVSTTVTAGSGVAGATPGRITAAVERTADRADVVVVQIHGGEQYRRQPTERMRRLTDAAVDAGADLVVNHHPHVAGGVQRRDGAVAAWSMGNLVFDQTLWETFPTCLLTAAVTADGVVRATVDPLLVDGFVPHGVIGKPRRVVSQRVAASSGPSVRLTDTGLATGPRSRGLTPVSVSGDRTVHARTAGWIRDAPADRVRVGRDLLPTGSFESVDVDSEGYDGALWRFAREPDAVRPGVGVDGGGGVRLHRISGNRSNVVLSNSRRIPVDGPLTLAARYRTDATDGVRVSVAWYDDTSGEAIERETRPLTPTDGEWRVTSDDLVPPADATHCNVLFVLSPPRAGTRTALIDDVRLVEWAPLGTTGGREFDHVYATRPTTVRAVDPQHATADWSRLDGVTADHPTTPD